CLASGKAKRLLALAGPLDFLHFDIGDDAPARVVHDDARILRELPRAGDECKVTVMLAKDLQQSIDGLWLDDLVAGNHKHRALKSHLLEHLRADADGVAGAARLILIGEKDVIEAIANRLHHLSGAIANNDAVAFYAAEVVGFDRAVDGRHARDFKTHLVFGG